METKHEASEYGITAYANMYTPEGFLDELQLIADGCGMACNRRGAWLDVSGGSDNLRKMSRVLRRVAKTDGWEYLSSYFFMVADRLDDADKCRSVATGMFQCDKYSYDEGYSLAIGGGPYAIEHRCNMR